MNPLSSHPPRTPRASVVSDSHVYGGDIYTPKEEVMEEQPEYFSEDEDDKAQVEAKSRIRKEDVWRELLKTSYGRDKAFVRHSLNDIREFGPLDVTVCLEMHAI